MSYCTHCKSRPCNVSQWGGWVEARLFWIQSHQFQKLALKTCLESAIKWLFRLELKPSSPHLGQILVLENNKANDFYTSQKAFFF